MPFLAVLAAAAQVGKGENAAGFKPREERGGEEGRGRDKVTQTKCSVDSEGKLRAAVTFKVIHKG
ncbi:MAG TPA: hypothetical protein VK157_03420, partial [Phycisphaerales bacterium]|nr:hypothetical protein [Phycisphaerales bacterium]